MITFLFSCTIFNNIFISALKKANVVVTATADHNIKSGGSDIRIVRILLDGEEISFDSIQKDGDWLHADGVWMVVNPDKPCILTFSANDVKRDCRSSCKWEKISENRFIFAALGYLSFSTRDWPGFYIQQSGGICMCTDCSYVFTAWVDKTV